MSMLKLFKELMNMFLWIQGVSGCRLSHGLAQWSESIDSFSWRSCLT